MVRTRLNKYVEASGLVEHIPLRSIIPSKYPLRDQLGNVDALADSVKSSGLLQPIIVRPSNSKFEIISGHRRYQAFRLNHLPEIPAIVVDVPEKEAFELSLEENLQRESLDTIEEAKAFKFYVDKYGYGSVTQLAKRIGRSEEFVSHRIKLLDLPEDVQELVGRRLLSSSDAWEISRVTTKAEQEELAQRAVEGGLTVKELRQAANQSVRKSNVGLTKEKLEEEYGMPQYRGTDANYKNAKLKKEMSFILRLALLRIDDLANNLDNDEDTLRQDILAVRQKIHSILDGHLSSKLKHGETVNEVTEFLKSYLKSMNSAKTRRIQTFKSKSFTVFDDIVPDILDYDDCTEQDVTLSKMLREGNSTIENLRVRVLAGGAVATFIYHYKWKIGKTDYEWKSRASVVLERTNDSWAMIHAHWSPYGFEHPVIDMVRKAVKPMTN